MFLDSNHYELTAKYYFYKLIFLQNNLLINLFCVVEQNNLKEPNHFQIYNYYILIIIFKQIFNSLNTIMLYIKLFKQPTTMNGF